MPRLVPVPDDDPDLVRLVTDMVAEMIGLYGGDLGTWRLVPPSGRWSVLRDDDGAPVGCGGLLPLSGSEPTASATQGEVKRVYVVPAARGRGLARTIMLGLTAEAPAYGYDELWLETGTAQPHAIALYDSLGWRRIPAYGPWADVHSVCFALRLDT